MIRKKASHDHIKAVQPCC
uniref:Uncharacterized protein n=1 Tax=Anguilla anguilla TaxID=7936 RepID=A0A0E9V5E6_ANGAN